MRTTAVLALIAFAPSGPVLAQGPAASPSRDGAPVVVSPAWLAGRSSDAAVVVLHVGHENDFAQGRIPGARPLNYMDIVTGRDGLSSELPDPGQLRAVFERAGVSDSALVVVYAHAGPMAARVLFSLAYLGHRRLAMLDGGLEQWRAEGHPVATGAAAAVTPGRMTGQPRADLVATADWISANAGRAGVSLIDTRTDGEYLGSGNRSGMPSHGHLAGARQLEWESLFQPGSSNRLKPRAELERIYGDLVRPGDTVVTYCWVGYRASATWFVASLLGHEARLYDGSYQDWQRRGLPVRAGERP